MPAQKTVPVFPKDFLWGASISAHQVEGNNHNQWSVWELENAKALASQSTYKDTWLPRWDEVKAEALKPENYVSGKAADHYNRYEQDFDLLKKLNMNALRFSIEWSRIQPNGEKDWNHEAVEHYREYIRQLKTRDIEPIVTLWHFTHPVWFEEKGGFAKYNNLKYFVKFADRIMREIGREVRYVVTVNEPDTYAFKSFYEAAWPPQKHNGWTMVETYRNLLIAHNQIYGKLRKHRRGYKVGLAKTCNYLYPGDEKLATKAAMRLRRFAVDNVPLYRVKHRLDFIGVNYYFAERVIGRRIKNPDKHQSDTGNDLQPQNIEQVLVRLHKKYKKPLIITENGLSDAKDRDRQWWLRETMKAIIRAERRGVRLRGYLHWSLIDNFEWSSGFWPRFGLVEIDYKTLKRRPRKSALWFAGLIKKMRSEG